MKSHFIPFDESDILTCGLKLPSEFTYPFYYTAHPLAVLAAEGLQKKLSSLDLDHNFGFLDDEKGKVIGKMFGVLVVKSKSGILGYLSAFSGKLAGTNHHLGFVPPVFDMLTEDGFYRYEEEQLNKINRLVRELEDDENFASQKKILEQKEMELTHFKKEYKNEYRKDKIKRDEARADAKIKYEGSELTDALYQIEKESITQTRNFRRAVKSKNEVINVLREEIMIIEKQIAALKVERKAKSQATQKELFDQYTFLNAKGESKSLWDIFFVECGVIPPSGAGECALPKLLQYAFENEYEPVCMAEFWWGQSPNNQIRKHLNYYPSCKSKCHPILGHMLQGLEVEDNPLETISISKELDIVFEDSWILAINKPYGVLSVPGKKIVDSIYTIVQSKYPDLTGPLIVHRLDMSTSGLLLLAKTKAVHQALQRQFSERTIKKKYVALLEGELKSNEGKVELPIILDYDNRPQQMVCYERGKPAITHYKKVEYSEGITRVHFFPLTGRTHQLRVHAAHRSGLDMPILGDDIYGKKSDRLYLHAESLEYTHPITEKKMKIKCRVPF